jgi:spore germination protein KC
MIKAFMVKTMGCGLLAILLICPIGGCWSYRGINETTIVSGVAIDKDAATGNYQITYEIVDLTRDIKETGVQPKIVEAEGKTLFDAARNAKKRLVNKLYFGNTQIIVVDQNIAGEGISSIVDWFLRDAECRETLNLVVSQQETAKDILTLKGIDEMLVAYEVRKIIEEDQNVTASTKSAELYSIFNTLHDEGISLTVPAFRSVMNHEDLTAEVNGVGVFKGDRLIGYLTPTETNYYLFIIDEIRAGVLTLSLEGEQTDDISLEIYKNKTEVSCSYKDGKAKAQINIKTEVALDELETELGLLDEHLMKEIAAKEAQKLEDEILSVIKKVQAEYGSDIFGFGNKLYKSDPKLWKEIRPEWDVLFQEMDVEIVCEISIVNTASLVSS